MSSEKRLLILSYDFPPSNGGIARLCNEIAQGLSPYYKNIMVVTREVDGPSIPYHSQNIEIKRFTEKRGVLEYKILSYLKTLNDKNTDILCGVWHPEGILAKLAGFKNIYILGHGTEFLHANIWWRKNIWLKIYCNYILKSITCLITNSHYTKQLAESISDKAYIKAIPLGVNSDFFCPKNAERTDTEKINIVSLSRIFKFKGYDFIAETLASLPADYQSKIVWNIGGTGPYLEDLKQLVDYLKIGNITNFHGFVADEKLPEFYSENDLFVLCTREEKNTTDVEGFGLVFIEAQACGIPAIGTATGGIKDAIDNNNGGWLIEQDNVVQFSNLLKKLIDKKSILKDQGLLARDRILKTSTLKKYCEKINLLMNE